MDSCPKMLVVDARMINASGIGTDLQNLLPYLKSHFEITLLGNPNELEKYPWTSGLSIIKFTEKIYSVGEQFYLPLVIPTCDYFFSPHFNVPVLPIRAKRRIVLIHDVYHLAATTINPVHKRYARFLLQSSLDKSDRIITISEFSRAEIKKYLKTGKKQIHKISLGVDHSIYHPVHDLAILDEVRNRYSLPADFILFVGNVKPHKNLKNLVLACSKLQKAPYANLKLVIVGKKEGFITGDNSLQDLVIQLGMSDRITFTGYVENEHLPVMYRLASLFVFPSLYEGFGLPPLEAMASGCPAIVSNAASMPEVCQDACYYFDGKNPDSITTAIQEVLENTELRRSLIAKGLKLAQKYTWKESAAQLREIILNH